MPHQITTGRRIKRDSKLTKPNILLILTDDQEAGTVTPEVMPYLTSEPNGNWVTFPYGIISTPLCGVIRATMLTGQTWQRHKVKSHDPTQLAKLNEAEAIPTAMSAAGYRTGLIGKYENLWPDYTSTPSGYVPPGWDTFWGRTIEGAVYYDWGAFTNIPNAPTVGFGTPADYTTDVISGLANNFIRTQDSRPWFLMLTPGSPHDPPTPAPRHQSLQFTVTDPPDFNTVTPGQPTWLQNRGTLTSNDQALTRGTRVNGRRALRSVDELIQTQMIALAEMGQLENTVVIYMTDNSVMMGRKRLATNAPGATIEKRVPYHSSTDALLRIRYPGAPARVETAPVTATDVSCSIVGMAGGSYVHPVDGSYKLDKIILNDPAAQRRQSAYSTYAAGVPVPDWDMILRNDQMKYVAYNTGEKEVYDLNADPDEMNNLIGVNPTRDAAMAAELAQHVANPMFWEV